MNKSWKAAHKKNISNITYFNYKKNGYYTNKCFKIF